ncbi:MAG TPA: hypothetical protein VHI52_05545, partial [Verrucomicrobiae bacterium]|nr:hypothetical protein [Verrucomicrobiae bacterium]
MEERRLNIRRIIFFWLGAVVALLLFEILWHYYHTGRVIITTDNKYNTITLSRIDASGHSIGKSTKAYSKLSKTLDTGQYTVSVNGNSVATVQTFTLKPRQTLRFTINPINTAGVEPVVYERADALAASAQQLVYFNSTSGGVFQIDAQNNLTRIAGGRPFQAVKWANPSFGVAQNNQDNHYGGLFVLNNGAVSTLKMPFFHSPSQTINFDVASDKAIDVSYGSAVYAGGQDGKFKKVYTAPSSNPTLAAGANGEVAISAPRFGPHPSGASKPVLATVDSSGDTYKKNVEAERMAWSPNGRYLATLNDSSPTIYDDELDIFAVV